MRRRALGDWRISTDANVKLGSQRLALISYFWVPDIKIRKRDRVRIRYCPAAVTGNNEIELSAARYHTLLASSQNREDYCAAKVSIPEWVMALHYWSVHSWRACL